MEKEEGFWWGKGGRDKGGIKGWGKGVGFWMGLKVGNGGRVKGGIRWGERRRVKGGIRWGKSRKVKGEKGEDFGW